MTVCKMHKLLIINLLKINHLLFIAEDMTMCIKLWNCDILYQFHLWLFLFMTGSVYFSCTVVRQINKRSFTWMASKGLHGLTCELLWTSSNTKHIRKLDTLIAAERSKILQRRGQAFWQGARVRDRTIQSNPHNNAQFPKLRKIPHNTERFA